MSGDIAIIGNGEGITALKAGGVDAFTVDGVEQARETLKRLAKTYKVIFITDDLARGTDDIIKRTAEKPYPIVISVPNEKGENGYAFEKLQERMERALGVNLLFKDGDK